MANDAPRPEIFVSYSHRDEEAKDFVNRHLKVLQTAGNVDVWDDRRITIGDDWYQEIEAKLHSSAVAVLLISADFLSSEFCIKEEVSRLLERRKRDGMMIAPILLRHCAWEIFPWLSAIQMLPRDDTPLLELEKSQQERELKHVVLAIHKFLKEQGALVAAAIEKARETGERAEIHGENSTVVEVDGDDVSIIPGPKASTKHPPLPNELIDLTRLPVSGYDVVGRDDELRMLDEALDGTTLNVISFRAWGGVGKSTLVNKWCEYLAADNFRGAKRVFAWSFYSQGLSDRTTSADAFIDAALRFFDDEDPETGSAWAKGERLAELVGKEKALLILDGMEPLQDEHQGIKDPALARLVECLAAENVGLCVITTREPVKELQDFPETTREKDLVYLTQQAGRALLRIKGLRATDELLEQVSEAFDSHALALDLLASYLKRFAGSDVSQALDLPDLPYITVDAGKHPRRVMAAFAQKFGEGPELDLLHITGLFDRPADARCIASLRQPPVIPGLTDHLVQDGSDRLAQWWRQATDKQEAPSSDAIWEKLLTYLRDLGLFAKASHHAPDDLDAHPLVREHFGAQLRIERVDAWKAGHDRLYEHLKDVPEEHRPDTLAEMAPLFQAVHHGCQAGRRQEALDEVYHDRIVRKGEEYLIKKLGAFGADLGLVASFFDPPFEHPAVDLIDPARAWLLSQAAFRLRALGRLGEAIAPMQAGLEMAGEQEDWGEAARRASNLSELQLALGDVAAAVASGEVAVDHADRSGGAFERMVWRTTLADAKHQAGVLAAASAIFEKAETMQAERQSTYPRLYSLPSYRYCGLLLTLGQAEAVRERGAYGLDLANKFLGQGLSLIDIGLGHLSLGQAAWALGDRDEARTRLDQAVEGLREAGTMDHLPRGLLARAAFFRAINESERARKDLDEVMRIATRCGMRLFECDAHLEYARLALAEDQPDAARVHLNSAASLVRECGYHRRDPEITELEEKLIP